MGLKQWWARITGAEGTAEAEDVEQAPPVPTEDDILTALDRVRDQASQGAVPAAVTSRLRRIDTSIRETMPRLRNLGMGSIDAYSVMATATDYLPEAIGGYLRLPRDWADSRPIDNGKSSLLVLIDQLDLLGATMDRIFDAVNAHDAQALIAHGRFLTEKFGTASSGGQLNLGSGTAAVPPPPRSTLDLEDT